MVMDELAIPASVPPQSIPSNFEPITSEFNEVLLPPATNFVMSQSQDATTLLTGDLGLKSEWVPEEPLAGKADEDEEEDESDDQICITLDKPSHPLKIQNAEQGEKRETEELHFLNSNGLQYLLFRQSNKYIVGCRGVAQLGGLVPVM